MGELKVVHMFLLIKTFQEGWALHGHVSQQIYKTKQKIKIKPLFV